MTVDHLPTSLDEAPELPDEVETTETVETHAAPRSTKLPKAESEAEADWPQTGFGSFP